MYSHDIKPHLKKILEKLSKRDKNQYEQVLKKIEEIIKSDSIDHYKNLRHDMKDCKRVHIPLAIVSNKVLVTCSISIGIIVFFI